MSKNVTQKQLQKLLGFTGVVIALLLLVGACLAYMGRTFATTHVHDQLAQERITFPQAGTPSLDPKEFPGLQKYAGQPVDTGVKAKAYADEFIWVHMMKASGGKTYAEVSAAAQAAPTDQKLAGLKNTLFQGDMLRSSLLTAYAFSVFGTIAGYALVTCLAAAVLVLLVALSRFAKAARS